MSSTAFDVQVAAMGRKAKQVPAVSVSDRMFAALLSLIFCGLGQINQRRFVAAITFLISCIAAALVFPPLTIIFWVWAAVDAYRWNG